MRLYPELPSRRLAAMGHDALLVAALVVLAWLGMQVHDAVDQLSALGRGVQQAGGGIEQGFSSAAEAVGGTPLIGDALADQLRGAGRGTGGEIAEAGRQGEDSVRRLADLLGWLVFGLPAALLLWRQLPERLAQVRRLRAAARVLGNPLDEERRRAVAMRAAFALPYGDLLRHTRDPLGDLTAGRYEPLLRAAFEEAGLTAPASSPGSPA
jgi:hypothetical protein